MDNNLELVNEAVLIFVIDSFFAFTSVINAGNVNDIDMNGNRTNFGNIGSEENLEEARSLAGWVYIMLFVGNILIHITFMLINIGRMTKLKCKRSIAIGKRNLSREKAFQERMQGNKIENGVQNRQFFFGMCLRMCCNKKARTQDLKLELVQKEKELEQLKRVNTDLKISLRETTRFSPA